MVAVGFIDDSSSAYGNARHHRAADITGNGGVDGADQLALLGSWNGYGVGDLNRDGVVDGGDLLIMQANWGGEMVAGELSQTDNIIGYAGYIFNAELVSADSTGLYTVRHRHYAPDLGRWLSRDPLGYVDGMSLYEYVRGRPQSLTDLYGLAAGWATMIHRRYRYHFPLGPGWADPGDVGPWPIDPSDTIPGQLYDFPSLTPTQQIVTPLLTEPPKIPRQFEDTTRDLFENPSSPSPNRGRPRPNRYGPPPSAPDSLPDRRMPGRLPGGGRPGGGGGCVPFAPV